ncbi:hypothetical protein [Enterococcus lactis]|uniref:hypothetical protein n=1 Tax=Enterococcus lactis TaxID=357441 RepID=UPI0040414CBD
MKYKKIVATLMLSAMTLHLMQQGSAIYAEEQSVNISTTNSIATSKAEEKVFSTENTVNKTNSTTRITNIYYQNQLKNTSLLFDSSPNLTDWLVQSGHYEFSLSTVTSFRYQSGAYYATSQGASHCLVPQTNGLEYRWTKGAYTSGAGSVGILKQQKNDENIILNRSYTASVNVNNLRDAYSAQLLFDDKVAALHQGTRTTITKKMTTKNYNWRIMLDHAGMSGTVTISIFNPELKMTYAALISKILLATPVLS